MHGGGVLVEEGLGNGIGFDDRVHHARLQPPRKRVGAPANTSPWWRRRSVYGSVIAVVAVLAMLSAFIDAVATASLMGTLRREAVDTHTQSTWRCQAMHGAVERAECLAQRTPIPEHNADLRPPR
jgi:hypothetical protein